jgi:hypothetical protein
MRLLLLSGPTSTPLDALLLGRFRRRVSVLARAGPVIPTTLPALKKARPPGGPRQSGMRCDHLSKPGTLRQPHLSVDVLDRPCVPVGGPNVGVPQPASLLGPSPSRGARGRQPVQTDTVRWIATGVTVRRNRNGDRRNVEARVELIAYATVLFSSRRSRGARR